MDNFEQSIQNLREQALQSRLNTLSQQVNSLESHIQADIIMKNQLETDLRNVEDPRRRARLNQAIQENTENLHRHEEELDSLRRTLDKILQNHIDEDINIKNQLTNNLRVERDERHRDRINAEITRRTEHLHQHEEEGDNLRERLDSLKETIGSMSTLLEQMNY
ncbi:MAG: hypothetical protein RMY28_034185 [Nostoc sp. ChiSLP01]|nr:hypothetical protein [Nostoc sp. CmiSLP01]MDZ8283480.1 hypothetical protein [Nostoc sp. ChiSLP01]